MCVILSRNPALNERGGRRLGFDPVAAVVPRPFRRRQGYSDGGGVQLDSDGMQLGDEGRPPLSLFAYPPCVTGPGSPRPSRATRQEPTVLMKATVIAIAPDLQLFLPLQHMAQSTQSGLSQLQGLSPPPPPAPPSHIHSL
jgi:hypothetical protein